MYRTNWFDKIGWYIHANNWNFKEIRDYMLEDFLKDGITEEILRQENHISFTGYLDLIDYWISKGYTTKQIINYIAVG